MKRKFFIGLLFFLFSTIQIFPQELIRHCLVKAQTYMEKEDCDSASYFYNIYVKAAKDYPELPKKDVKLEAFIKECNNPKPQTGFLRIEGNNSILSESTITIIDNKGKRIDGKMFIGIKQELPIGNFNVQIRHDRFLPYEDSVIIVAGRTKTLTTVLQPNYAKFTLKVGKNAAIFVEDLDKPKGYGECEVNLDFDRSYKIECHLNGRKNTSIDKQINKYTEKTIQLTTPTFYTFFITGHLAVSNNNYKRIYPWGLSVGWLFVDRLGAFLCGLSNFNTISSQADCDEKGYLEDGYYPSYSDKTVERWSVIGGLLVRCGYWNGDWFIKAGGGIGTRNLYFIANNGNHYRNRYYSKEKTFEGLLGVQFHFGQFVITIDGTTNFNTSEIRIGAGVAF